MPKRQIVRIDAAKCNGCGQCVSACAEGAIALVDGKAKLVKDSYCDGLGACLGECPQDAITIEAREADSFDEAAAMAHKHGAAQSSQLGQWPIQLALVPTSAPFLRGRELALVADCVGFAFPELHPEVLSGRAVAIACPKLDDADGRGYVGKLATIFREAGVTKVTVYRMEVPCCSGLTRLAREALVASGAELPFEEVIMGIDGQVAE